MPNSDSFDGLLRKALLTQAIPPLPASLVRTWQKPRAETAAKWLWIMPGLVFVFGVSIGTWLAPMGLSNAFNALGAALLGFWQNVPESTFSWAFALLLAVAVIACDSIRGVFRRLK